MQDIITAIQLLGEGGPVITVDHGYNYGAMSALHGDTGDHRLSLVCDGPCLADQNRKFLTARALYPDVTAKSLRAVSDIVGSRFYVPPAMLTRILRDADPVATVGPEAVRFEGFSACCSTYIRLDIGDGALDVSHRANGTTNVDFGPALRGALASVRKDAALELRIGADAVEIMHEGKALVEKKVPLPLRWIKGFAEVQVIMAGMVPAFQLNRIAAQRLLRDVSQGRNDGLNWVSVTGGVARVTPRESRVQGKVTVPLRGGHRLRVLEPLLNLANTLDVFVNTATGASAWVLHFGHQRLCLTVNLDPWQGFSGDGGLLSQLATSYGTAAAAIRAQLIWQDQIDLADMALATGLSEEAVQGALAELAATGLVGFDLHRGRYFHRVLPFDMKKVTALNPRLNAARALVDAGAVHMSGDVADVVSGEVTHKVRRDGGDWRCTCPWNAKHQGQRGPCKHILAVAAHLEAAQ